MFVTYEPVTVAIGFEYILNAVLEALLARRSAYALHHNHNDDDNNNTMMVRRYNAGRAWLQRIK